MDRFTWETVAFALTQSTTFKSHCCVAENMTLSGEKAFKVAATQQGPVFFGLKQMHNEKHSVFDIEDKFHDRVPCSDWVRCMVAHEADDAMQLADLEYEESGPGAINAVG